MPWLLPDYYKGRGKEAAYEHIPMSHIPPTCFHSKYPPPRANLGWGWQREPAPTGPGELAGMGDLGTGRGICSLLCFSKAFCFFTSWCLFHNSTPDAMWAGEKDRESQRLVRQTKWKPTHPRWFSLGYRITNQEIKRDLHCGGGGLKKNQEI